MRSEIYSPVERDEGIPMTDMEHETLYEIIEPGCRSGHIVYRPSAMTCVLSLHPDGSGWSNPPKHIMVRRLPKGFQVTLKQE